MILLSCETSGLVIRLQAIPPSLNGCSASSIRGADMPALVSAGVTKEQLLAVWSENRDTGFTPAQLKEAGVTVAEMRSHGLTIAQIHVGGVSIADLRSGRVADYLVFNEACNTPQTRGTAPSPTVTLTTTTLSATDTQVVLTANSRGSLRWSSTELIGMNMSIFFHSASVIGVDEAVGDVTGRLLSHDGGSFISTLSIPLADVFSNPTVSVEDSQFSTTNIQLCPGS